MKKTEYYELPGLEQIYLEDSFVTDISIGQSEIVFSLEAVLTENHPLYCPPLSDEQYCFRKANLAFLNVQTVKWLSRTEKFFTDAENKIDYGNIDVFYRIGETYYLEGDWGKLELDASSISFQINQK